MHAAALHAAAPAAARVRPDTQGRAAPSAASQRRHRSLLRAAQPACAPRDPLPRAVASRRPLLRARRAVVAAGAGEPAAWEDEFELQDASRANGGPHVRAVECGSWRALEAAGWVLLDVRPRSEVERVHVKGSVHVPLFDDDDDGSLSGALKQAVAYSTGGFWQGTRHVKANASFLQDVRAAVPASTPVLVACQKGLRSLAACEQLVRGGYATVSWLSGGFDAACASDFDTSNGKDMRHGAVGGLAGALGLSDVQREEAAAGRLVPGWVTPVIAFALINWLSVTWLMQLKPPGAP